MLTNSDGSITSSSNPEVPPLPERFAVTVLAELAYIRSTLEELRGEACRRRVIEHGLSLEDVMRIFDVHRTQSECEHLRRLLAQVGLTVK